MPAFAASRRRQGEEEADEAAGGGAGGEGVADPDGLNGAIGDALDREGGPGSRGKGVRGFGTINDIGHVFGTRESESEAIGITNGLEGRFSDQGVHAESIFREIAPAIAIGVGGVSREARADLRCGEIAGAPVCQRHAADDEGAGGRALVGAMVNDGIDGVAAVVSGCGGGSVVGHGDGQACRGGGG